MGVGTAKDIAQYFHIESWWDRTSAAGRRPAVKLESYFDELVEERRLEPARGEGWSRPAFVVPGMSIPLSIDARAIVSPFDPLLWERRWTNAVFGFEYQIEIYVPAAKRVHGYFVLPNQTKNQNTTHNNQKTDHKHTTQHKQTTHVEPG